MKKKNIIISSLVILLVLVAAAGIISHSRKQSSEKGRKILFYRNPMNPEITSPVFKKDEMGMDYIPVYENEAGPTKEGVQISPEKQQLVGIKTTEVKKQDLMREIRTIGKIAYDPELYVAQ